eukprot:gnl/TRDRNA2_/TRDRNA2_153919_c0_seq6.p1 gnl/TRDRNA2_/TRDRNA2_153919_c0~~gnl/TRDRNA2_/TRDRNA2_153919_c0_seq6.p1  ORF type:complete len:449 (-),score=116.02 gnl/TRDRNA2_/TRDRNA2_153919_c0_seq6:118-1464(-)
MASDSQSLLDKYKVESDASSSTIDLLVAIHDFTPSWKNFPATRNCAGLLSKVKPMGVQDPSEATKMVLDEPLLEACMAATTVEDSKHLQYILTALYDMLREDSSYFQSYDECLKKGSFQFFSPLMALLQSPKSNDQYIADKAAWLLSAVMGHVPKGFTEADAKSVATLLLNGAMCSPLGTLEAITNLLKCDRFRAPVCQTPGVADKIFAVERTAPSPVLYRSVFAIWAMSFDQQNSSVLKSRKAVKYLKEILNYSRVEKVVRLALTVLKNFLGDKAMCEEIAEEGMLEVVAPLEYEKWRDAELYDDIREVVQKISSEVKELSSYDRYERELATGKLAWGFIHSDKFWAENVMKFESNDFRSVKLLAGLIQSDTTDPTTLSVACHDIGEFVSLHPLGKKKVAQLRVKERVMELMGSTEPQHREVRREALLCCQKIMLNKWQDIQTAEKK